MSTPQDPSSDRAPAKKTSAAKKAAPAKNAAAAKKAAPAKKVAGPRKAPTANTPALAKRAAPRPPEPPQQEPVVIAGERLESGGAQAASEQETSAESPPAPAPTVAHNGPWRLLVSAGWPRATRAQFVVALLCGVLGFALVTQVRSQEGSGLTTARQSDLVDVLDNLSAKSDQLRAQIGDEQATLAKLTGGSNQTDAALQEAQQRLATLRILAGTVGATGPGIDLAITDPRDSVTADVVLDTVEELRDAGAEALEISGTGATGHVAVRLVASSAFVDAETGRGIVVDGVPLTPPYDVLAIGDPHTLAQALTIPGGVLDTLKGKNATGAVSQRASVRITSLHSLSGPQYARPTASPAASG